ncbi:MAG: CbiX/SirB N-terminal domain-containing protein [Cyanobium sp.]
MPDGSSGADAGAGVAEALSPGSSLGQDQLQGGSAMVSAPRWAAAMSQPVAPADLPPAGDPQRWSWLQELRRHPPAAIEPWLEALESGTLPLERDLVTVLAEHLDGEGAIRLLACWLQQPQLDPELPALFAHRRDPLWAQRLRQILGPESTAPSSAESRASWVAVALLPLLGHQRDRCDFPRLRGALLDPGPLVLRQAALEGLCRGLSAWPLAPLRQTLMQAAGDLQPRLAAAALDALARLPAARPSLLALEAMALAPELEQRRQRRLQALPVSPLLLLVHGRSGGEQPAELQELAAELSRRRGAPVWLQTLTGTPLPALQQRSALETPLTLVPLLLFPGNHVRSDLPALAQLLRRGGPLRRRPFLGAWQPWQQALAREVAATADRWPGPSRSASPRLLHHPLEGALAGRFLAMLARRCGGCCQAASPDALPRGDGPWLPLALASNRLTEALQAAGWEAAASRPLLARDKLRQVLLEQLLALP